MHHHSEINFSKQHILSGFVGFWVGWLVGRFVFVCLVCLVCLVVVVVAVVVFWGEGVLLCLFYYALCCFRVYL